MHADCASPDGPAAPKEASIATEIELKLAAQPRDLPALTNALEARAAAEGASTARLVSTYFDTPDHALARRGLTLRVRERNGRFTQTVKSADAIWPTSLERGEWEDPVAGALPDPTAPTTGRFLAAAVSDQLEPLFRTEIVRRTVRLSPGSGNCVEAAIDRGRVSTPAGGAREPLNEVELELKFGSRTVLYDLAFALLEVAPLRLEPRSKAERGYRLAAPEVAPVAAVHANGVDLAPATSGDEALQRIGFACLDQVMRNEPAVLAGLEEGIHQMRVGIRRLRAVLSAFAKMMPEDQRRWASDELRWLAEALGDARNLDVFETNIVAAARQGVADAGVAALTEAAERRRRSAYRRAASAVRSPRYTRSLLNLLRWFETRGWQGSDAARELSAPIAAVADQVLDRRRRAAKRWSRNFADQSAAQRHRLRIALKKLRYATDALAGLYDPREVGQFTKGLKRLQDALGDANDVRVARDIVAMLARPRATTGAIAEAGAAVLAWHERRLARREPKLRKHLERLFDAEPFWSR